MRSVLSALLCCVAPLACGGASPAAASSVASATSPAPAEAPPPPPPAVLATANAAAVAPLRGAETTDTPDGGGSSPGVAFGTGNLDSGFGGGPRPTSANASASDAGAGQQPGKRGLSADQVRHVVMTHVGAVRACYELEAQHDPSLKGGVTVQWTIDAGGKVTSASVVTSTLGSPRVEGCVVRQVRSWRFPSSETPTVIAGFPFKFGVGGP